MVSLEGSAEQVPSDTRPDAGGGRNPITPTEGRIEDFESLATQAHVAHRAKDWALSEYRWQAILERFPDQVRAVIGLAEALLQQEKFEAAERLLADNLSLDPGNRDILFFWARAAEGRVDWQEAERRWGDFVRLFPSTIRAWAGQVTARIKSGDFSGAEIVATAALELFPGSEEVLALHARVASHARNWAEAARRWDCVRCLAEGNADYWVQQARALRQQGRLAETSDLLLDAAKRFPGHRVIIRMAAEVLRELGLWPQSCVFWDALRRLEPDDRQLQERAFEASWRALGTGALEATQTSQTIVAENKDHPRNTMLRFEPFGCDSEFGLIQRHFGAEPLGLLRWAEIPTDKLILALDNDLEGIGGSDFTKLKLGSDFKLRDRRFDFASHTWVTEDQVDRAAFLEQQCRRLQYLCRNMIEDIEEGTKILVYKSAADESIDEIMRLHRAIRRIGPATLLYVRTALADRPSGTIEQVTDGLLIGYLGKLVGSGNSNIDHPGWRALLRKTLVLVDAADEQTVNDLPPRELVQRFESLGNNCEFGYVQRIEGAEPMGLLRWSTTKVPMLADAFEQGLAGLGDPQNTEIYTHLDFRAVDQRYELSAQTFVGAEETDREKLLGEQCQRMRHLRQKLLADLRAGTKIFVHKASPTASMNDLHALHAAVRRHGPATLLCVQKALPGAAQGVVHEASPGLLVAGLQRLVAVGGGWDADYESWLSICRQAMGFHQPEHLQSVA